MYNTYPFVLPTSFSFQGIDHCPDIFIANVTTTSQVDHTKLPVLYHMGRDPGERYPIRMGSREYLENVAKLKVVEEEHKKTLRIPARPQLNWCDRAVEVEWLNPRTGC